MSEAHRALLRQLFDVAVAAVVPAVCLPDHLPAAAGRTVVVGAGKAAAAMAAVTAEQLPTAEGLVVTRYGHGVDSTGSIEVVEAAHPVPDAAGRQAAARMLDMVRGLKFDDQVICLLSGGGSALLVAPVAALTLKDKQAVTGALLRSGASIGEINCVRKHLSAIKGGRLAAAAHPAAVLTLAISDVAGDDPAVIASGPTVADPTTFAEARAVLRKYAIEPPATIAAHLAAAAEETPKAGDPRLARAETVIVARAGSALAAAARRAEEAGYQARLLGDEIEGDSATVARQHARLALEAREAGQRLAILSGGETTVTVRGSGRGGPNAEYALALALALDGAAGITALAADSDGIDGSEDNAGAICLPDTLARARAAGLDPQGHLADNDSYGFFAALGDLVMSGPTRTNVNDFRVILVAPEGRGR
ncbi:MAG: glycerate kinase [Alphaproteobacteria bacterium]|jgi:hydroxypyruvate reductase|nr:glycerate kinase [Alphaproteobacteria bacterium]